MIIVEGYPNDVNFGKSEVHFRIGGQYYDPIEWSFESEIDAGFGPSIGWGAGIIAASGTLVFPPVSHHDSRVFSPWGQGVWPPSRGDVVTITAGYDGKVALIFTGIVSSISGGTNSNLVVSIRDNIDRLRTVVELPPMMATSPRLDWTTEQNFISQGLSSPFFLSRTAQLCGYHTVPNLAGGNGQLFYSGMNGSFTPVRGVTSKCSRYDATIYNRWPWWKQAPWGQGAYNLDATVLPSPSASQFLRITPNRPLSLSFIRGEGGTQSGALRAHWGDVNIRLHASNTSDSAYLQLTTPSSTWRSDSIPLHRDEVVVGVFHHGGAYELRNSLGDSVTGMLSWTSRFQNEDMSHITVNIPEGGVQLAATQVYMGVNWSPLEFERTFHLDNTASIGTLSATKAVDMSALNLIQEICSAELASAWLNNQGHLVFKNRNTLMSQEPVATKTALDDLLSYDWEINENSAKRQVFVQYTETFERRTSLPKITVWQGSGDQLEAQELQETFIGPSPDEEWIAVQPSIWDQDEGDTWAGYPSALNEGVYSWAIGSAGEDEHEHYKSTSTTIEQLGPRRWVIRSQPSGEVLQRIPTSPNNGALVSENWQGEPTPIIRAKGQIKFSDAKAQSSILGPSWAEDYTHDAGQWVQTPTNAESIADFIALYTSVPMIEVSNVRILPDPRLERGDVILLRDDQINNRVIRGLVTGIRHSGDEDSWKMTINLQVISTTSTSDTYEDQRLSWLGDSYQEQADYWSTEQPVNSYEAQRRRSTWR